jgi:hypothetical protein
MWRYKAGRCLREELRDLLMNEVADMRERMQQLTSQLREAARPSSRPGAVAFAFERAVLDTVRDARATQFDEAWRNFQLAMAALKTTQETWMAYQTIAQLKDRLSGLASQLEGTAFITVQDFHVFLSRAMNFYGQEKYRTARFIAAESLDSLARLTTAAPESEPSPAGLLQRIAELNDLAGTLEAWEVGSMDAAEIRKAAAALRRTALMRQFEFLRLLVSDLEADQAPVSTFVATVQARVENEGAAALARQMLGITGEGERPDWAAATERLLVRSFTQISERLEAQTPKAK